MVSKEKSTLDLMNGIVEQLRQQRRTLIETLTAQKQPVDHIAEQVIKLNVLIDGVKAATDDENKSEGIEGYFKWLAR